MICVNSLPKTLHAHYWSKANGGDERIRISDLNDVNVAL